MDLKFRRDADEGPAESAPVLNTRTHPAITDTHALPLPLYFTNLSYTHTRTHTHTHTHTHRDVDSYNDSELSRLSEESTFIYTARDEGIEQYLRQLTAGIKAPKELELRVGAQVETACVPEGCGAIVSDEKRLTCYALIYCNVVSFFLSLFLYCAAL